MEELTSIIQVVQRNILSAKLLARFEGNGPVYEWTGLRTDQLIADLGEISWNKEFFICNNPELDECGQPCVSFTTMGIPLSEFSRQQPSPRKI